MVQTPHILSQGHQRKSRLVSLIPLHFQLLFVKKGGYHKTIIFVTLSSGSVIDSKAKSVPNYNDVTHTQVLIDSSSCKPSSVCQILSNTTGYEVILLDSKCYPLLDNEATSCMDFLRSTRKILATSKSQYEKLTGKKFTGTAVDLIKEGNTDELVSTSNASL